MWNGTAAILNASPANTNTSPNRSAGATARRRKLIGRVHARELVVPVKPYSRRNAVEQDAARQRAQDEIFEPRLGRAHVARTKLASTYCEKDSAARARRIASAGRRPKPSCPCRAVEAGSGSGIRRAAAPPARKMPDATIMIATAARRYRSAPWRTRRRMSARYRPRQRTRRLWALPAPQQGATSRHATSIATARPC